MLVAIRPQGIVLLKDADGRILAHELYYSVSKARKAYERARVPNQEGWHVLQDEWGEREQAFQNAKVMCDYIPEHLRTHADPFRKSFLSLSKEEEIELAEKLALPLDIIREIADLERSAAERKRYFGHSYGAQTEGLIRRYAPKSIARLLRSR